MPKVIRSRPAARSSNDCNEDVLMHPQLARLIDELDHAQARLDRLSDEVPEDRWSGRSDPSRWSAAECIAHLNLTSEAYIPRLMKAIEKARKLPRAGNRRYKRDPLGWFLGKMFGPLPKIGSVRFGRVKTMPAFVPESDRPKQEIVSEFKRLQTELTRMVRESDGLAIDRVSIVSPFGDRIHYSCYSAFVLIARHEERHLQQAELAI
jgi:hypothetical protein